MSYFCIIFESGKVLSSLGYTIEEKGVGKVVVEKLCVTERRIMILKRIFKNHKTTRQELADEFCVSTKTVSRDIDFLSSFAPIYTKNGNYGGIYIVTEYTEHRHCLTDEEEKCLYGLMDRATDREREILF